MPDQTKKQRYESVRAEMKRSRTTFEPWWRDVADNILPSRLQLTQSDRQRGDRRNQKIIDSTGSFAARTLGSGMHAGVTSPARSWFRLSTPDPDLAEFGPVKEWLDLVRQGMEGVFHKSNLYQVLPTHYEDLGTFGTSAFALMEDDESTIRCYDFPVGSFWIANDRRRRVRVFVHETSLSVRQLVEQYGKRKPSGGYDWSNFSARVKNAWDRARYEEQIEIVQVVEPNVDYDPSKLESKRKRFLSCHYEVGNTADVMLEETGFDEFPLLASRWQVTGNDVYGTNCPGLMALGDIRQLQHGEKRGLQILDKINAPPMVGSVAMKQAALNMLPGGTSFVDETSDKKYRAAFDVSSFRFDLHENKQEQVRGRVRKAYFEDLFLMLAYSDQSRGAQPVTATEIQVRQEEKLLVLGPVLERLNQDLLNPLIDRTFAIMVRKGMIPEAPDELQGQALKVEYISIMAQAQKRVGLGSLHEFVGVLGQMAEFDPQILDKVDRDQIIDEFGSALSLPPRIIVPDEDVANVRQSRAQQQAAQAKTAMLKDASQGAKNLAQADTSGKNALTDLAGAGAAA